MQRVDVGRRSSLWITPDNELFREYHDTNTWTGPLPQHLDAKGRWRCSQNRRVDCLRTPAREPEGSVFRGAQAPRAIPAHIHTALAHLSRGPSSIRGLANMCGVEESTAWSYATRVVEIWPEAHVYARELVDPSVLDALKHTKDRSGRLKDLIPRMGGGHEWRELRDRYAHLRLARICILAEEGE